MIKDVLKNCAKGLLAFVFLVPAFSYGIYNLGPFYIKDLVVDFTYHFIGKTNVSVRTAFDLIVPAETPATGAVDGAFNTPYGIAVDATNDRLYVVDSANRRVQRFVLSTGAFAGAIGKSSLSGTCASGAQSTWCTGGVFSAGDGDGAFNYPMGIALDVAGDRMYVVDQNNHRVQKFILSSGAYEGTIGKSTASSGTCVTGAQTGWCTGGAFSSSSSGALDGQFNTPKDLVIDKTHGFLFVMDYGNYRIQKFNLSSGAFVGSIGKSSGAGVDCVVGVQTSWCRGGSFVVGSVDGAFGQMGGIAIDEGAQRLYVTDFSSFRVQKFNSDSGAFMGAIGNTNVASGTCALGAQNNWCAGGTFVSGSGDGMFSGAAGIAVDASKGLLYVSDITSDRIQKFTLSTGAALGSIGLNSAVSGTNCAVGAQIRWCQKGSFASGTDGGAFSDPRRIAVDSLKKKVLVTESINHRVQRISY